MGINLRVRHSFPVRPILGRRVQPRARKYGWKITWKLRLNALNRDEQRNT